MANSLIKISSPSKFIWNIEKFSTLNMEEMHKSDCFTVGGCEWLVQIYGNSNEGKQLSVTLQSDALQNRWFYAEYTLSIINQKNKAKTVKRDTQHLFRDQEPHGWPSLMPLSEFRGPKKGFVVNDTCIIHVDISACSINVSNIKVAPTNQPVLYPNAGKTFEEDQGVVFYDEKFIDVGGFSVSKTQATIYRKIWLKFGHIASTKVMPASSFNSMVTVVSDIMNTVLNMYRCRFEDVSAEKIVLWDTKIKMAEKLEFNVRWLRDRFEVVRKDFYGVQKYNSALKQEDQQQPSAQPTKKRAIDTENGVKIAKPEPTDELNQEDQPLSQPTKKRAVDTENGLKVPKPEPTDESNHCLPGYLFEGIL